MFYKYSKTAKEMEKKKEQHIMSWNAVLWWVT